MSVDLKQPDEKLIQKVNELIIKFNREDKTVWGSAQKDPNLMA